MDKVNFNTKNLLQKNQPGKPEKYSPNAKQKKLVTAMFSRMEQLFRGKWTSAEGPKLDVEGKFTDNCIFWWQVTWDLTDDHWRNAFKRIDQEIVSKLRSGDESWPPNYIEFLEFTKPMGLSPDGKHVEAYKVFDPAKQITDQGAINRTIEAHKKHMENMKALRSW